MNNSCIQLGRRLRYGMVGGGSGAFIGGVHRMAAQLDGQIDLVAGCFSRDPKKSRAFGAGYQLSPDRVYANYAEMAATEAALPADQRIDFVSVVTRNDSHVAIAETFIKSGFHVVCEKPLASSLAEAIRLRDVVHRSGKIFALMHNYCGYPMVREAREGIRRGELGRILKVIVEYSQGYAVRRIEEDDSANTGWRADPAIAGASNCMGDIGTHAAHLARYVTGLEIEEICADLTSFVPGSVLDDDGSCLLRFKGGARGILHASQIANGEENNLCLRVYGTQAALEWHQEQPNDLVMKSAGKSSTICRRGNRYVGIDAKSVTRLPPGHPEGFIEAFANIYQSVATAIVAQSCGQETAEPECDYPTIDDGVHGAAFIEAVVKSTTSQHKWTHFLEA